MKKICPMNPSRRGQDTTACMRENCAWWNELSEECAIATIAKGIVFMLGEVAETEVKDDNIAVDEQNMPADESGT